MITALGTRKDSVTPSAQSTCQWQNRPIVAQQQNRFAVRLTVHGAGST